MFKKIVTPWPPIFYGGGVLVFLDTLLVAVK